MMIEPRSDEFQRMELMQATKTFLSRLNILHKVMMQALNKLFELRQAFECGFVSGSMFAMQYSWSKRQKIYQHWMKDSITLILMQNWSVKNNEMEEAPIVIDFDYPSSQLADNQESIRLKDMRYMSTMAIYSVVEPNFEYESKSTKVVTIAKPSNFAAGLMAELTRTVEFKSDYIKLYQFVLNEIEYIVSPEFSYPTKDQCHLKNYLFSSLAVEDSDHIRFKLLEPIESCFKAAFMFKEKSTGSNSGAECAR